MKWRCLFGLEKGHSYSGLRMFGTTSHRPTKLGVGSPHTAFLFNSRWFPFTDFGTRVVENTRGLATLMSQGWYC